MKIFHSARDSIETGILSKYALAFKVRETWERGGEDQTFRKKRVSVVPLNRLSIKNISWIACLS